MKEKDGLEDTEQVRLTFQNLDPMVRKQKADLDRRYEERRRYCRQNKEKRNQNMCIQIPSS